MWYWSAEFFEVMDRAVERDGTQHHSQIYINQTCLDTSILYYDYNLDKCHGGVFAIIL